MPQEQEQKNGTLRVFVTANDKVLTAIGVFGGLTLLFTAIENGIVFYFISLFIFCVLVRELNSRFPNWRENTIELFLFRVLCFVLFFGVVAYSSYSYFFTFGFFPFFIFLTCLLVFIGVILPKIKNFFQQQTMQS